MKIEKMKERIVDYWITNKPDKKTFRDMIDKLKDKDITCWVSKRNDAIDFVFIKEYPIRCTKFRSRN